MSVILIVCATDEEYNHLSELFRVDEKEHFKCGVFYSESKVYKNLYVCKTGIGKVNAALSVGLMSYLSVTHVFNIGYAAAIGNYKVGELVRVSEVVQWDFPEDLFKTSDPNRYQLSSSGSRLYTRDKFVTKSDVFNLNENALFDMEGYAVVKAALSTGISNISGIKDIILLKIVSDLPIQVLGNYDQYQESIRSLNKDVSNQILNEVLSVY